MPVRLVILLGFFMPSGLLRADRAADAAPIRPPASNTAAVPSDPRPKAGADDPLEALSGLKPQEVQETLQWLQSHAVDPESLSQDSLNRAALLHLLTHGKTGARILRSSPQVTPDATAGAPMNANTSTAPTALWGDLGSGAVYVRKGTPPTASGLSELRKFLAACSPESSLMILDLRASPGPAGLEETADWAGLFLPEGTPLFQMTASASGSAPRPVASRGAPVWNRDRRVWLLIDAESAPAMELLAHCLSRLHVAELTFGTPTSGAMTEFTDRPLGPDLMLRLPSLTVTWPDGSRLTGSPLLPAITVQPSPASKAVLMRLTDAAALPDHLVEKDRPRPSEAALLAGTPRELLSDAAAGPHSPAPAVDASSQPRPDPVLQQARDLNLTSRLLKLDTPEEIKRAEPAK